MTVAAQILRGFSIKPLFSEEVSLNGKPHQETVHTGSAMYEREALKNELQFSEVIKSHKPQCVKRGDGDKICASHCLVSQALSHYRV